MSRDQLINACRELHFAVRIDKARDHTPERSMIHADLVGPPMALRGKTERAAAELAEASPDDRYSSLARLRTV